MERFYHSVTLDVDKCVGCTNCIKRCPTEAIRVREGKAIITPERCIDCGVCIRVCPHHAKKAKFDHLEMLNRFTYNIALPAPSLYGQFRHLDHIDLILTALMIFLKFPKRQSWYRMLQEKSFWMEICQNRLSVRPVRPLCD